MALFPLNRVLYLFSITHNIFFTRLDNKRSLKMHKGQSELVSSTPGVFKETATLYPFARSLF